MNVTYSECVSVALVIQRAVLIPNVVICGLASFVIFSRIISWTAQLLKTELLSIKCVFWFSLQLLPETFLIPGRIQQDIINVPRSSHKVPVIFYVLLTLHLITFLCNNYQLDAIIILSLFHQSTYTCFGHICSPSSGSVLYIYIYIYIQQSVCFVLKRGMFKITWAYLRIIITRKTYCCYLHLLKA